jgi:hypothetical protein
VRPLRNQQPGTYYLWVHGPNADDPFEFEVRLFPPTIPPTNDQCRLAEPLFTDGGTSDVRFGTTRGATRSFDVSTFSAPLAADVLYSFELSTQSRFEVEVDPVAWDGGLLVPLVFVRNESDCNPDGGPNTDPNVLAHAPGRRVTEGARLVSSSLDAGRYLLGVQGVPLYDRLLGRHNTTGPFTLNARILPVAASPQNNTSCTASIPLGADGGAGLRGMTNLSVDSFAHVCSTAVAPDVFYTFTTPASPVTDAGFTAVVWAVSENLNELSPVVSVTQSCGVASSTLDCGRGGGTGFATIEGLQPNSTLSIAVSGTRAGQQGPFSWTSWTSCG